MITPTILILALYAPLEPAAKANEQPLAIEHNGYLRASDLDIQKWTISAEIGEGKALSIIRVTRLDGSNRLAIARESVEFSRKRRKVREDILIYDLAFFGDDLKRREFRVNGFGGSITFDASDVDSTGVGRGTSKTKGLWCVGDFEGHAGDKEKFLYLVYARIVDTKDYAYIEDLIKRGLDGGAHSRRLHLEDLPKEIKDRLGVE